jgi:hypothetical protein
MNKIITASAILFLAALPWEAHAADAPASVPPISHLGAPAPTAAVARHHRSTVHDVHGQRFDVPRRLMRNRDTLINGLPPQPAQFD